MTGASRTTSDIADATGNISRQLSPAQFARWWEKNKAVADVLFDGAERKTLDKLAADFAEKPASSAPPRARSGGTEPTGVGNHRPSDQWRDRPQNPQRSRWATSAPLPVDHARGRRNEPCGNAGACHPRPEVCRATGAGRRPAETCEKRAIYFQQRPCRERLR